MKGMILAGGKATRLYPITKGICKQLWPIYNKPRSYYPLSVLMLAGIRDILIISTPHDIDRFKDLFGDGRSVGLNISYAIQKKADGIAQAFLVGESFIGHDPVSLILGDNIFYGENFTSLLKQARSLKEGGLVFAYTVADPERYGVVSFNNKMEVTSIEEKPKNSKSKWAVTGLYFYDNDVIEITKSLKPSKRGELEITDVNKVYLKRNKLKVHLLGRGIAWLDTGTYDSLIDASIFIKTIEERQGLKIGAIEEIAYRNGFINKEELLNLSANIETSYGSYLRKLVENAQ